MADILCPKCGESQSEELEFCLFCQASLKPLNNSTPADDKSIQPGEAPAKKTASEAESALPAWLRKLRGRTSQKGLAAEQKDQVEQVEQEGSLEQSKDEPAALYSAEVELPADPVEEEGTDWLSGLEQTAQEEIETPAWMSSLKDMPQGERSPGERFDSDASKVEGNWLDNLRGDSLDHELEPEQKQAELPVEVPVIDGGIPEWMKKLQAEVDAQAAGSRLAEEDQIEGGVDDSPDWLNRLQTETSSPITPKENSTLENVAETPDWLEKMSARIPATSEEITPIEFETPEWLRNLQTETQAFAEDIQPAESESQALFEKSQPIDPESLDGSNELQAGPHDSTEDGKPESDLPDWLTDVETQALGMVDDSFQPLNETPDWLKEIAAETPALSAQESSLPIAETPDWLNAMSSELQHPTETVAMGLSADLLSNQDQLKDDELGKLTPGDLEPDLSTGLNVESEFSQQNLDEQLQPGAEGQQLDSELMPDWLKIIDTTDSASTESSARIMDEQFSGAGPQTLPSPEMPGWLNTLNSDDTISKSELAETEIGSSAELLSPAELPSWVQAMRPVESIVAEVGIPDINLEKITEKTGPLAGLQGVLPATPGLGKLRKPLNYSIKLRVTEEQSVQADLLGHMLGVEAQAKSTSSINRKLPQRILRWVVATLVFLVVASPIISGKQNTPAPSIYPPELVAAREILFNLPPASPVLLVFDYEPAYSGELEVTAAPMVDNLLFSGARLAILSTSPTGFSLAEHFLKTTQSQHNYQNGIQYVNLGYLAGGASGVLSFVLNPSQTMPRAMDGSLPWQSPLLQDIHTLADFKVVIILTDNSDTARIWVEQTGMTLADTPLLMAISAQAEPMIRPYYDSKQIKGLVTGLAGGKAYEQTLQLTGLGQKYWDSFSYGLFIAELIIIFGALWSIVSIWRNRKPVHEEEA